MLQNNALRLSGLFAIGTALYHAYEGQRLINAIGLESADFAFVTSTFQIGSLAWFAGGILLIATATLQSMKARNWIVGCLSLMYGLPGFGVLLMSLNDFSLGALLLPTVVVLANIGRKLPRPTQKAALAL